MGAASADFDNDGWPDIYVACDTAPSLLYRNNHDGTFREVAVPAGLCARRERGGPGRDGRRRRPTTTGTAGSTSSGRTSPSRSPTLYRNYGGGAFADASVKAGLGVNRKYLGFGVGFLDFDNDGWKDIFIANGHVYPQIADRNLHLTYRQPRMVYRNLRNGRFEDISAKVGDAIRAPTSRARLRLRGLRQRRRRRRGRQQSGRPSVRAAQRRRQPEQLDPRQVRGHALEPVRQSARACGSDRRGTDADRRGDERIQLLLAERLPAALRAGRGGHGGCRRDLRGRPARRRPSATCAANHLYVCREGEGIVGRRDVRVRSQP